MKTSYQSKKEDDASVYPKVKSVFEE